MRCTRFIPLGFIICAASLVLIGCNGSSAVPGSGSTPGNTPTGLTPSPTVAYVYVSSQTASGGPNQIVAYAADAKGQLAPVPGSPFNQSVSPMAASGGYLLAASLSQADINTYKIESNGALTLGSQFDYTHQTGYQASGGSTCGDVYGFVFDHSGKSLYTGVNSIDCSSNRGIASFAFDSSKGSLSYLGNVNIGYQSSAAISVLGNNAYAYSALYDACMYGGISAFSLSNTGLVDLTPFVQTPQYGPPAPPGAKISGVKLPSYSAGFTATDTTNHVAIGEYPCYVMTAGAGTLPVQLAAYTADASGNLTTTDTYATMPATTVDPQGVEMSPSGSLLAVGGEGGLQVFHFNGASPITSFGSALTTDNISQMFWDNSNHLYAITLNAVPPDVYPGKLHVFTVTDTSASEAPGSPYAITYPMALAVQPE